MSFLYFRITAHTKYNQCVKICGDHCQLGNWLPDKGVRLYTNEDIYPMWIHEEKIMVEKGTQIEFKVIIVDGENIHWEGGPNRQFTIQSSKTFIEVQFNQTMMLRRFQKLVDSAEYDQNDLNQVQKLSASREYNPFEEGDSSDNESMDSCLGVMRQKSMSIGDHDLQKALEDL